MSTANRVIKNTGYLYVKIGITMFISLYTTRLILDSLGISDFGIFNIVGGAIAMLGFLNAAMASATQRFMSYSEGEGNKEKQKSIFNVSIILHLGISIIVGFLLIIAGYFFFNGILKIPESRIFAAQVVYGSLIISTIFTIITVPYDAVINAHENMKYYAIIGILEAVLKLLIAFYCVYTSHDKLIIYGILMACIPLITLTIMCLFCHKNYKECIISPKKYWDKFLMKEIASFAGWNLFSTTTSMITNYGLGIILNMFFGTTLNAAQGVANQLNGQMSVFTNNITKAVSPVIVKSAGQNKQEKMMQISFFVSKIFFIINAILILPFIIYGETILSWWLKQVPPFTNIFLILIILNSIVEVFLNSLCQMMAAVGQIKGLFFYRSITTLFCLPIIGLFFYYNFPPYVMYIVIFAKTIVNIGISIYFSYKYYKFPVKYFIFNIFLKCMFAITIIYTLSYFYKLYFINENTLQSIISIIISIILSFIILISFIFNNEEKEIIKSTIKGLLRKCS